MRISVQSVHITKSEYLRIKEATQPNSLKIKRVFEATLNPEEDETAKCLNQVLIKSEMFLQYIGTSPSPPSNRNTYGEKVPPIEY